MSITVLDEVPGLIFLGFLWRIPVLTKHCGAKTQNGNIFDACLDLLGFKLF